MLPERMKRGEWVYDKERNRAYKILRAKRHPEYAEERMYVLEGNYGVSMPPYEREHLIEMGFKECLTEEELHAKINEGEYTPSEVTYKVGKKLKNGKGKSNTT